MQNLTKLMQNNYYNEIFVTKKYEIRLIKMFVDV